MATTGRRVEEPPEFDVGDRVIAAVNIGGIWRPRVPRHTGGIVVGRAPGGELEVHFAGERKELVEPSKLVHADPARP